MSSAVETAQGKALAKFFEHAGLTRIGDGRILAIRNTSAEGLSDFDRERLVCLQTNRMHATALERAGLRVVTEASGPFELCLVEATRDRDENLYHLALGWSMLAPGGMLVLSAANVLGGESLSRRITERGFPVLSTYSKAKCRVVALTRAAGATPLAAPEDWLALGEFRAIPETGLVACPGIFSAHAIDPGTRLLCDALAAPLAGCGADFGAGYGALSHHVLARSPAVRALDLYEVEWKGLAAAKRNLGHWEQRVDLAYQWADLTSTTPGRRYDWIIMNPPFHAGHMAAPGLGQRFIAVAADSLYSHGTVWLVANRHLPYEGMLGARFKQVVALGTASGYKVYRASQPITTRSASRTRKPSPPGVVRRL